MNSILYSCARCTSRLLPLLLSTIVLLTASFSVFPDRGFAQWVSVNNGLWGARTAAVESGVNGVILAATPAGIYRMENGLPWRLVSASTQLNTMVVMPTGSYVGAGADGIYRTTDNGDNWEKVDTLSQARLQDGSNGVLFAVTHGQLKRSTDEGRTWLATADTFSFGYTHPLAPGTDGVVYAANHSEIFRSTDDGVTWSKRGELPGIRDIVTTKKGVYAVVEGYNPKTGVYTSTDSGLSWKRISEVPLTDLVANSDSTLYGISASPFYPALNQSGFYRSTDNGKNWKLLSHPPPYNIDFTQDGALWICVNDSLLRSTDRGISWTPMNDGIMNRMTSGIVADDDGRVYALLSSTTRHAVTGSMYRTLYASDNGGGSWRMLRTKLDQGPFYIAGRDNLVARETEIFFGPGDYVSHAYTRYSTDNGLSWNGGFSGGVEHLVKDQGGRIAFRYAYSYEHSREDGVAISMDGGKSWRDTLFLPMGRNYAGCISALAVLNDGAGFLLSVVNPNYDRPMPNGPETANGIYRSDSNGNNWTLVSDSLVVSELIVDSNNVWIAAAYLRKDSTYATMGLYRSVDMGTTWRKIFDGNIDNLRAIGHGAYAVATPYSTFISYDQGTSWQELPERFTIQGLTEQGTIYALYDNTPYRSSDAGRSWKEVSDGLAGKNVYMLAVAPDGDVYASVSGYGIFKLAKPASVEYEPLDSEEPINITLTPNPVAGETIMAGLNLSGSTTISISITDILGHTVVAERELHLTGGRNQIPLNLRGLPSGSYFVRVSIGEGTMSQRFIRP